MSDARTDGHDRDAGHDGPDRADGRERPDRLETSLGFPWRFYRWLFVAMAALLGAQVLIAVLTDAPLRPGFLLAQVLPLVLSLPPALVLRRRPQVVDRDGVAPGAFRRRIPWSDVDHVRRPTRWQPYVTLVLRDGRERALSVEGEEGARDVARIGDVPLQD
ncbi:hypothetical protein KC207_09330 [Phycicoccus sp. BSK3Z-2]|uniref:PH domain-containing protein n=1 Tax=Phycicoccus avicenniae TaxID=2828860 RepID=A0A941D800_9MICO|nr:hypothetical protein [Phycicoccus avicenniae]MBR7743488.1 hypothetical protein [Phycicoccus avicenniae]